MEEQQFLVNVLPKPHSLLTRKQVLCRLTFWLVRMQSKLSGHALPITLHRGYHGQMLFACGVEPGASSTTCRRRVLLVFVTADTAGSYWLLLSQKGATGLPLADNRDHAEHRLSCHSDPEVICRLTICCSRAGSASGCFPSSTSRPCNR